MVLAHCLHLNQAPIKVGRSSIQLLAVGPWIGLRSSTRPQLLDQSSSFPRTLQNHSPQSAANTTGTPQIQRHHRQESLSSGYWCLDHLRRSLDVRPYLLPLEDYTFASFKCLRAKSKWHWPLKPMLESDQGCSSWAAMTLSTTLYRRNTKLLDFKLSRDTCDDLILIQVGEFVHQASAFLPTESFHKARTRMFNRSSLGQTQKEHEMPI